MEKGLLLSVIGAVVFSGCAGLSYQEQCVAALTEPAKPKKIESASAVIRDNYVNSERVYHIGDAWILFANKQIGTYVNRGSAVFISGQGDFTRDRVFDVADIGMYEGDYRISQTRPGCFSLAEEAASIEYGFLLRNRSYPYAVQGEDESIWAVEYFDYYQPFHLEQQAALTLTHPEAETLIFDDSDGQVTVNGESAQVVSVDVAFANRAYQLEDSGDTYLILGMQRRQNDARFYVLKNNETLLAYTGPKR